MEAIAYLAGRVLLGATVCLVWIKVITHFETFRVLQDIPNERSSHVKIIPRGAGICFPVVLILGLLLGGKSFYSDSISLMWAVTALFISVLGFIDDAVSISASLRLAFQIAICMPYLFLVTISMNGDPLLQVSFSLLFLIMIISSINFFNFADGINGYVALQFCLFLASWFCLENGGGRDSFLPIFAPLIGSLILFLWENMKRKSVFMGDAGSTCIGFLIATIPLEMTGPKAIGFEEMGELVATVSVLGFVVFIDIVSALAAKVVFHIPLAQPHREHFYQRLSRKKDWGHGKTSLLLLGVQLVISLLFLFKIKLEKSVASWASISLVICCGVYAIIVLLTNFKALRSYSLPSRH